MAKQWLLKSRPEGIPLDSDFELKTIELPALENGQVKVKNTYVSVDPYMRPRLSSREGSYANPYAIGGPIDGFSTGYVTESKSDAFKEGDRVIQMSGWCDEAVMDAGKIQKLPKDELSDSYYMSILGMTGATAYFGLLKIAEAKLGDTIFVSAAAGAVGSTVVQIAKAMGMTVIGSAGGPDKIAYVKSIGADAVIDYKITKPVLEQLQELAPQGLDVYFDNVGGEHLDAALAHAKVNARIAICGMITSYNTTETAYPYKYISNIIGRRIKMEGFLYSDFINYLPEFHAQIRVWLQKGLVHDYHTELQGIENVIEAFRGLFTGKNIGKMLVKI